MVENKTKLATGLAVTLIAACGGGGSDSGTDPGSGTPPPTTIDQDAAGAWVGTASLSVDPAANYSVIAVTDDAGAGYFLIGPYDDSNALPRYTMLIEAGLHTQGSAFKPDNPGRAWTQRRFNQDEPDLRFKNGLNYVEGVVSGSVIERASMKLSWVSVDGDTADFSLAYDADLYERQIDLSTLAGAWGNEIANVTIGTDGRGSGQYVDQVGSCSFSFTLVPLSQPVNFFRATYQSGECRGYRFITLFAFMSDDAVENNTLNIFLRGTSDGFASKAVSLRRQ